jgi:TctA family transporter
LGAVVFAIVGTLVGANGVAFIMANVLHKGMSWFGAEYFPIILYSPAAMAGMWSKGSALSGILLMCVEQAR